MMHIDGRPTQSIAAGNSHRQTPCTTYGSGQDISMDSLHILLRPAMVIDGHVSGYIVVDNADRLTASPVYCGHNRLLLPSFQLYCRRQDLSIDAWIIVADNVEGEKKQNAERRVYGKMDLDEVLLKPLFFCYMCPQRQILEKFGSEIQSSQGLRYVVCYSVRANARPLF